jgi:hypothetical protein
MKIGNYLIYLAHTNSDVYNELILSVYSFKRYHHDNKIKIIIYTDNENYLKDYLNAFDIIYVSINHETINSWLGGKHGVCKTKIACLLDASKRFTGNFLLVDTATYFTNHSIHLFQQVQALRLALHVFEKQLDRSGNYKGLYGKGIVINGRTYLLTSKTEIWNTGVIGISSYQNFLLEEANLLCDYMYKLNHTNVAEQVALSVVFQKENKIVNADYAIFHYANLKEIRPELNRLLSKPEAKTNTYLQTLVRSVNPKYIWHEKLEWKRQNRFRMPLFKLFNIPFRLHPIKIYI